ncbi:3-phytase [Novosphingobium sp. PC22D]|uniref:phytase n=1 Tax=Novosphingobium sp. PC22D TaxID=1962403 RepID=UPI000BEFD9B8|nr:phytase [Novosphingobium sp. PC22D]PEQ10249.1 3-phytase [Novosphingobium sp. PC22D]
MRSSALLALAACVSGCATAGSTAGVSLPAVDIVAKGETAPVGTAKADAADDPAIWRNAADPAASLVLGTDKKAGLYVYGLDGKTRDFVAAGALNNVDLRELGDGRILVAASDRTDPARPRIALFLLDGRSARLTQLGAHPFLPESHGPAEAYGFCMGKALGEGELARAYVVMKDGEVAETALVENAGAIAPRYLRSMKVATQSEGCVVDDVTGNLYLGEENVGIWRFDLSQPQPGAQSFAEVGVADGLVADVEGLAIDRGEGRSWLIASSQGDNAYAVFDLATGDPVGRFRIAAGSLGATSETDGIELATGSFGDAYPRGLFVAQDGDNAPAAQNFKFVDWGVIVSLLTAQ